MRALVTGADGFVGRWLVRHLEDSGDEVFQATGAPVHEIAETRHIDVRDAAAVGAVVRDSLPEVIYHLAGVSFPPDASRTDADAAAITVGGTINLLQAAAAVDPPPVVLIPSSAEVYGTGSVVDGLTEDDPVRPVTPYGFTKAAQEFVALAYDRAGSVRTVVARAFNHIGPGQRPMFVVSSFAHQVAAVAVGRQQAQIAVGNLESRRDFTDVRDVVRAYRLLATGGLSGEPYNVASGRAARIGDVLDELIRISGVTVEVVVDPARIRSTDAPRVVGSAAKLTAATGWQAEIPLERTLRDVWDDALARAGSQAAIGAAH